MKIQAIEWEIISIVGDRPLKKSHLEKMTKDGMYDLKHHLDKWIPTVKVDTMIALSIREFRFLTDKQALELRQWLEAHPKVSSVETLSQKEMIVTNKVGKVCARITILLACGTSNFHIDKKKKSARMSKKEKAEARERARLAMEGPTADGKAQITEEEVVTEEEEVEEVPVAVAVAVPAEIPAVESTGGFTQLWDGELYKEINSILKNDHDYESQAL